MVGARKIMLRALGLACVLGLPVLGQVATPERGKVYASPDLFEAEIRKFEAADKVQMLTFIDAGHDLLTAKGEPRPELYEKDKLHMTRAGYLLWRDTVRAILLAHEQAYANPAGTPPCRSPSSRHALPRPFTATGKAL